jgi:uncharacterized membrane protein YgcG
MQPLFILVTVMKLAMALAAFAAIAATFSTMTTIVASFTGAAIARAGAGGMVIFNAVSITGKSSSKGGNGHQGGNSKHSFHKVRV